MKPNYIIHMYNLFNHCPTWWRAIFQFLTTSAMMNIHIVFGLGLNMFISYLSSVNCFSHPYSIQPLNSYVEIKDIQP